MNTLFTPLKMGASELANRANRENNGSFLVLPGVWQELA